MKLISTAGRGARAGRVSIAALLARRNAAYERALPAARRIVDGVRKGGDAALRRYAEKFDGNTQPQQ
ncbi:MAG: histidinol dehydrogenase, partial [Silvibacterium sp.]